MGSGQSSADQSVSAVEPRFADQLVSAMEPRAAAQLVLPAAAEPRSADQLASAVERRSADQLVSAPEPRRSRWPMYDASRLEAGLAAVLDHRGVVRDLRRLIADYCLPQRLLVMFDPVSS